MSNYKGRGRSTVHQPSKAGKPVEINLPTKQEGELLRILWDSDVPLTCVQCWEKMREVYRSHRWVCPSTIAITQQLQRLYKKDLAIQHKAPMAMYSPRYSRVLLAHKQIEEMFEQYGVTPEERNAIFEFSDT